MTTVNGGSERIVRASPGLAHAAGGVWLLVLLAAVGCGKTSIPTYPVSGTVTLDGQALDGATVMFVPKSGPPHGAVTDAAGAFSIRGKLGVPAGMCGVMITKASAGGEALSNPTPEDLQCGTTAKPERSAVPQNYGRSETSGLTAEVTTDASKNVFTFQLQR